MNDRSYPHDICVFVGRFQPFHNGHQAVITRALAEAAHVIVLVGSAFKPRSPKNPLTFEERRSIIAACNPEAEKRLHILPLMDTVYDDDAWATSVRTAVAMTVRRVLGHVEDASIALAGYRKDGSSYYLNLFPEWGAVAVEPVEDGVDTLNATDIRRCFFETGRWPEAVMPPKGASALAGFAESGVETWQRLGEESAFLAEYTAAIREAEVRWGGYPIQIQTVDAVVVQSGHILLVERDGFPGKGLWALPGGHVRADEAMEDAMLRELYEECRMDVPRGILKSNIVTSKRYDHPERSERGRVITEAFLVRLRNDRSLEKVRGGDDARRAFWIPIAEVDPRMMLEDHYDIIQDLLDMPQMMNAIYVPYLNS